MDEKRRPERAMVEETAGFIPTDDTKREATSAGVEPYRGRWLEAATREELISVLEGASCGIAVLESLPGKTLYINPACFEMTGYDLSEAPTTRHAQKIMFPRTKIGRSEARHLETMLESGQSQFLQRIRRKTGETAVCEVSNVVLHDGTVVGAWTDVTRRESAEGELRHREAQFRLFFEQSFDAAFLVEGERVVDCNNASLEMLRCIDKMELVGRTFWDLSAQEGRQHSVTSKKAGRIIHSALKKKRLRFEWALRRSDGTSFPAEITITATILDRRAILYVLVRDISALKEAETLAAGIRKELAHRIKERTAALTRANGQLRKRTSQISDVNKKLKESQEELRHLLEHLNRATEDERTRIAREAHDELGHFLMGLKMDLSYLKKTLPGQPKIMEKQVASMEQQIDQALGVVGQICSDLRPHVLDQLGLSAALEWYIKTFERKSGISCISEITQDIPPIKKEQATVLFRVFQEAMSNALRHSGATQVRVVFAHRAGLLFVRVEDNGKGITREDLTSSQSFGIIGIRERVRFWGGTSTFKALKSGGTSVTITIPVDRFKRDRNTCKTPQHTSEATHDQGSDSRRPFSRS
jgi:PAS domain S-box-containing protein